MRFVACCVLPIAMLLVGCGGQNEPVMAHGKPVDHWLGELNNPEAKARKKAVTCLGHVGTADSRAIPALIGAVKDRDATVRSEAILALLNIGPDAKDAIPALREAENDKDTTVRSHAKKALARIQSGQ
jgi:HEAT repeat protein